ncbi:MAG TPA: class I SAM-dependent methyltransferase, partial [Dehalococcoidia bacterium]|nr:class I SAM-dependent methyltransferase [Dehalococcoidia bacterium]
VEGSAVLDLGCGDGELSFFVELFQPARVLAIDAAAYNRNGMEACYVLKESLASGVEFVNADVHTLDIRQLGPFDITFCFGFLYHSPHPQWVLENLARCTGALLLTTRIFDNDGSYAYFYDVGESNNDPTNWWCFTTRALELMLKRAGFRLSFVERLDSHVGKSDPVDPALDGRAFVYATV